MIGRIKSIFINISTISPIKVAQILLLVIPAFVCSYTYIMSAGNSVDAIFNDSIITVHFLTVLTYPFCYLICKSACTKLVEEKNDDMYIVKLLLLIVSQIITLNFICAALFMYSLIKDYGKSLFKLNLQKMNVKNNIADIIGILLIIIINSFTLFVKFRLNII